MKPVSLKRLGRSSPLRSLAPEGYIVRSIAMIALAICPEIICACISQASGHWDLFERSGSVTTIIGLLLASRPYFEHTVTDLVIAHADEDAVFKPDEVLSDILAAKRGLTLSAFGSLIWGYLGGGYICDGGASACWRSGWSMWCIGHIATRYCNAVVTTFCSLARVGLVRTRLNGAGVIAGRKRTCPLRIHSHAGLVRIRRLHIERTGHFSARPARQALQLHALDVSR